MNQWNIRIPLRTLVQILKQARAPVKIVIHILQCFFRIQFNIQFNLITLLSLIFLSRFLKMKEQTTDYTCKENDHTFQ